MATALPYQGKLTMPITFSRTPNKQTIAAGSYEISTTVGPRPWKETVSFTWRLTATEANELVALIENDKGNGIYTYNHNSRGVMILRAQGDLAVGEVHDGLITVVTASFTRVR